MNNNNLLNIYQTLFKNYGVQNWWPAETPFEVAIGAILTQNTSWNNVEKSIKKIKEKNLLTPEALYNLTINELSELIKSSGFFNLKAQRIFNFLNFFKQFNYNFEALKKIKNIRYELLKISGIGQETADSILLYSMNLPYFVVDVYTKRLFYRSGLISYEKIKYEELQKIVHSNIDRDYRLYNEFHALIVNHCKIYCRKKPLCKYCILSINCNYREKI